MTSRLVEMQARFQQRQIQEREEKLLQLYENQQQRAFERMNRGSAGSNGSNGNLGNTMGGKVRQMFDERRQKAGIDRSYPLEPLKNSSADKLKNSTRKTVVKTVQKSVNHIKNSKPVINKKEIIHSIYNNNDGDETYEEYRYGDNANTLPNRPHTDLVELMNNHNLDDSIENEEMPQIGFDSPDDLGFTRKLSNLGGKLPSETAPKVSDEKHKISGNTLGKTFRKETKPLVKRTVKPTVVSPQNLKTSPPAKSPLVKSLTSPISSPVKSAPHSMQNKITPIAKGSSQPPSARAPSNARPSAKQTAKSPVARDDLTDCKFCNRRFASDRLQVHESICGKTLKKKRKAYDATKHRVEGTELAQYARKGNIKNANTKTKQVSKKDWRQTHEEFINAIRAAKSAQAHLAKGGKLSDLPPPPPSSNPDYVQCPHCSRKFNEGAAQRHIPKCANYMFNKPKGGAKATGKSR